jgi:hypothetical protein
MAYCTCPGWLWWWRTWWNEDWQGKPKYTEKTCPLRPPQIPLDQTRARTRAATVGSQRLTAWAMARPGHVLRQLSISIWSKNISCGSIVFPYTGEIWVKYGKLGLPDNVVPKCLFVFRCQFFNSN